MLRALWRGEEGFVVSSELVLIATLLVVGLLVGLVAVRNAVTAELADVARAIGNTDQTYSYSSITGHTASVTGAQFDDNADHCENQADAAAGSVNQCIDVNVTTVPAGGAG
jgi:hypothetical protein